jgi:NAD(P)-dependent dehydrogenase (short-subunit alcohol dehydrogenase family)
MLDLNLRSAFLLSRAVLPHMLSNGWGRIVRVSFKAAVDPRANQVGYDVSKLGVIVLTEAMSLEAKGSGVTANVLLPIIIDTRDNCTAMSRADPGKWVPLEQIAVTMQFLCPAEAAAINGARLRTYGVG